jgi:hypothetical protein
MTTKYWFWPQDCCSNSEHFLKQFVTSLSLVDGMHYTPSGKFERGDYDPDLSLIKNWVQNFEGSAPYGIMLDKSRTAGDENCTISLEPFKENRPVLLNLTGRTYNRTAIMTAIEKTLLVGLFLRLEDKTVEPEQLQDIKLYDNLSLLKSAKLVNYESVIGQIQAFDHFRQLNTNEPFWDLVGTSDSNGMWKLEEAALKYAIISSNNDSPIVIKDLICVGRKFPYPHPKVNSGYAIFRNCLFKNCEIVVHCWCGPQFRGCKFEDCTFRFMQGLYNIEGKGKMCSIEGYKLIIESSC